jgi:hypothetical protein
VLARFTIAVIQQAGVLILLVAGSIIVSIQHFDVEI